MFFYRIMKVGKQLRDKGEQAYFAISNTDEMSRELDECGIEEKGGDKPVVCAWDSQNKKFKMTETFRLVIITFFCTKQSLLV